MKKLIITILMGFLFQTANAQKSDQKLIGVYKSTISQACIVIYKSNKQLRAKVYEDFAMIKNNLYSKEEYSYRLLGDKNCPDFIVSYSEPVFENLYGADDPIEFTIPQENEFNKTISEFFTKSGTKFKPLRLML